MTLVMIAIITAGFSASALYLPEFPFPPTPLLVVHGIVTFSWYGLTASQAWLIGNSNYALHRKMGQASLILAALILATGYVVVSGAIAKPTNSIGGLTPAGSTIFPSMDLLGFVLFYGLALIRRNDGAAHKRLIVLAGLMMLPPATARLGLAIGLEPLPAVAALAIAGAFLIYDWRTRKRPHWASVLGLVVAAGGAPLRFIVGSSDEWERFAQAFYGA
ncbi:hypothetical protein [Altererythrobacter lutimaris]|nr:hypothetical protein [Altererythrobacter lutimaris]